MIKVFYVSISAAVAGIAAAFYYGGLEGVFLTTILAFLEISLSFDNAIVNASVLKDMAEVWQRRFLTWGIIIAVFGMRLVFPVVLVSLITSLSPSAVIDLALENPEKYAMYLTLAHGTISSFGGMFLLMVFLEFLFDHERNSHWLGLIERQVSKFGNIEAMEVITALIILMFIQQFVADGMRASILIAGISGIAIYAIVHGVAKYLNNQLGTKAGESIKRGGFISFVYLEFLDASFSFDGVIGAFAITKDIVLITLGLGIGAFFVRSLTIMLVQNQTLQKYKYLEHGAYYALGCLSIMMLASIFFHIPEVMIGGLGAIVIGLSLVSSIRAQKA